MTLPLHCRLASSGDLPCFFFLGRLWDWSFGQELGVSNGLSLGFVWVFSCLTLSLFASGSHVAIEDWWMVSMLYIAKIFY